MMFFASVEVFADKIADHRADNFVTLNCIQINIIVFRPTINILKSELY